MNDFIETFKKIVNIIFDFLQKLLISIFVFFWKVIVFIFQHWLATIFIILIIYFILSKKKDIQYYLLCKRTEHEVRSKFGYTIYLTAPIRTGKTTLMSGLSHILTNVLIRVALGTKRKIKKIIVEANFLEIDQIIQKCFISQISISNAVKVVIEMNPILFSKTYQDPVDREKSYAVLIEDYVKAEYALLTNNYVFSAKETPFYNRITENYRKQFDFTSMQLKNAYDEKIFQLTNYNIILEDEKGLDGDKKESKYMTASKEDDGMPEFLRIIGNAGQETIYYITTNQEASRWVSTERHLMTTNILIKELKVIRMHSFYRRMIAFFNRIVQFFYSISIRLHFGELRKQVYMNRPNLFKRLNKKLVYKDQELFSKSVIEYKVAVYDNVDDVGKNNTTTNIYYEDMVLYLPLTYCFGNIDTHLYSFIFDSLQASSKVTLFDSMEKTGILTNEEKAAVVSKLLTRKNKTKEKDSSSQEESEDPTINPPNLD